MGAYRIDQDRDDAVTMSSDENSVARYLDQLASLITALPREPIYRAAKHLHTRWQLGASFITAGNGGSAATASHLAGDLCKATRHDLRKPVRAMCLNDNMTALTAWANDTTYGQALAEQLHSLGESGDVFIPISGSGNSVNILQATAYAKDHRMFVIALTGMGGQLAAMADIVIAVPSLDMPLIEDCHMAIGHVLTNAVREAIAR